MQITYCNLLRHHSKRKIRNFANQKMFFVSSVHSKPPKSVRIFVINDSSLYNIFTFLQICPKLSVFEKKYFPKQYIGIFPPCMIIYTYFSNQSEKKHSTSSEICNFQRSDDPCTTHCPSSVPVISSAVRVPCCHSHNFPKAKQPPRAPIFQMRTRVVLRNI